MRWMWMGLMAGFMAACGQEGLEITEPQGEEMMEIDISQSSLRCSALCMAECDRSYNECVSDCDAQGRCFWQMQ